MCHSDFMHAYKVVSGHLDGDKARQDPFQDRIMDESLLVNQYPTEKLRMFKKQADEGGHCSLMARYMTPEMFERYKDKVSGGNGKWTIARAINTGTMFPKAYMGIHAGDPESYDTFRDIYQPCIEGYHVGFQWDAGHAQQTDLNPENLSVHLTPEARALVASTRIRLARNLGAPYIMNPNGSAESRIDVLNLVKRAVEKLDEDLKGRVIEHASMTEDEEKALIADHFLFRGRDKRQAACGYHEYWPHGRGIFQARDKQFNMWINEGDHLRVMVLIPSADIEAVLSKLARGLAGIERCVASETQSTQPFASHPVLGIITCCPTNLGTGCRASVHMRLPRLVHSLGLEGIDEICRQHNCQARGSAGEFSELGAGKEDEFTKVDISNRFRLGYSEVELVEHMITTANVLAAMETEAEETQRN